MGRHPAHEDGIRIGGPNDPVARSIRREQRADAAPSPAEARRKHRDHLAEQGCQVCDESDPDALSMVRIPVPICDNDQGPPDPFETVVLCDEHYRPPSVLARARQVQMARNQDADVLVIYACGATTTASWTVPDDDDLAQSGAPYLAQTDFETWPPQAKRQRADPPSVPAIHVGRDCGAVIDDVIRID